MQPASHIHDEIEEIFDRLDEDGDRHISFAEFSTVMLQMDRAAPEHSLRVSFDAIDKDRNGRVSFEEFRAWVSP